jgi:Transglutaminase-like superfamily
VTVAAASNALSSASLTTDPDGARVALRAPFGVHFYMIRLDSDDLAWCNIDGVLVFLDIVKDRYFTLADAENQSMHDKIASTGDAHWHQPSWLPKPSGLAPVLTTSDALDSYPFNLAGVARAMWVQRRVEHRLAAKGFAEIISYLHMTINSRPCSEHASSEVAGRTIAAFAHSQLIRTAADRCLPRSIALALCLAARGVRAHVVIGVKLRPFGAHCWVQADGQTLNESVAEVHRYEPILVI